MAPIYTSLGLCYLLHCTATVPVTVLLVLVVLRVLVEEDVSLLVVLEVVVMLIVLVLPRQQHGEKSTEKKGHTSSLFFINFGVSFFCVSL